MNQEAKKLVAEYMYWTPLILNNKAQVVIDDVRDVYFDLNDAGLVVEEMVKRNIILHYDSFMSYAHEKWDRESTGPDGSKARFHAWLFNADNFFTAFVEWRKGNEPTNT
jgi:hypothetical protein